MTDEEYRPCDCDGPGYCMRHSMVKGPRKYELCRVREDYRKLWDEQADNNRAGQLERDREEEILAAPSRGLGDTIAKLLNKVGITKKRVARLMGKDEKSGCGGCRRRQEGLNKLFPYKKEDGEGA